MGVEVTIGEKSEKVFNRQTFDQVVYPGDRIMVVFSNQAAVRKAYRLLTGHEIPQSNDVYGIHMKGFMRGGEVIVTTYVEEQNSNRVFVDFQKPIQAETGSTTAGDLNIRFFDDEKEPR